MATARKAVEKAQEHLSGNKPDFKKATKELSKAVEVSPDFALAWELLGQIKLREDKPKDAREDFERAIAADEAYYLAYLELARLDAMAKQWQSCADNASTLLELNPNLGEAYYLH